MKAITRYVCPSIVLVVLIYATVSVGRDGLSSYYLESAAADSSMAVAEDAIRLNPSSPDAFHVRAGLLQKQEKLTEALNDLNRAIQLRPRDHFVWLELGYCRFQLHDVDGAIVAMRESARLAPFYSQPRWYLGNVLLQTGSLEEGFAEIRRAVASDPLYLESAIQIAEQAYGDDAQAIARAIRPQTSANRLRLAEYFIKQNNVPKAIELFTEAGADISATDRLTLVADLLAAKKFSEAHQLWLSARPDNRSSLTLINDGSFESEITPENSGFEWHVTRNLPRVTVTRDQSEAQAGSFCLRVDFNGVSPLNTPIVSQILMADASAHYQLKVAYRSRQLVTGGPPLIAIVDANDGQILGQSKTLPRDQAKWANESIEFMTKSTTNAVTIVIQRDQCPSSPCPAFGYAWFDGFDLGKL